MITFLRPLTPGWLLAIGSALLISIGNLYGQSNAPAAVTVAPVSTNWTTAQDHRNMMEQLGITKLRPGRNGNPNATNNPANYHEAKANPFPNWPELLVTKDGRKVANVDLWWKVRRPE